MAKNKFTAILISIFIIITTLAFSSITVAASQLTGLEVNVKQFGAKGDGVTNDTRAITNAFNSVAKAKKNGIVYFPAGDYLVNITITVPAGVSISGDSRESTTIKRTDVSNTAIFNLKGKQIIRDIGFKSRINLYPTGDDITIVDCKITGITQGIQNAATINRLKISRTLFEKCGYGFLSNNVPSYDVTISDCSFINSTADDIEINSPSKGFLIENCNFKDNISKSIVSGFGIGVAVHASKITIRNCNFLNIACQAIHCEDYSQVDIIKCTFKNSGRYNHPGSPHSDIAVLRGAKADVSYCVFLKSDSEYSTMGIYNNNAEIRDCKFYEKWSGYSSDYYNCEFYGDESLAAGSRLGKGIDSPSTAKTVQDCKFYNLAIGVEFGYLAAGSYGGTVQNCIFTNCDIGVGAKRTSNMIYAGSSEVVKNNLFKLCNVGVSLPNGGDAPRRNYIVVDNLFSSCKTNLILGTYIPGYERLVANNRDLPNIEANGINVQRLAGLSRIETSIAIAKDQYTDNEPDAVVLATAVNFADALAGSGLAYKYNAPLMLVNKTVSGSKSVLDYIEANLERSKNIYILGGTGAVSKEVSDYLTSKRYNIIRLGGVDRYGTNQKIFDYLNTPKGTSIVMATGGGFADALSISSVADIKGYPILLNNKENLSASVSKDITNIQPATIYIIGGTGVLSANIETQIKKINSKITIVRLGGSNRYETSMKIMEYFNLTTATITVATGLDFPDALSGSVLAARMNCSVLLVDNKNIAKQSELLNKHKITNVIVFGGEGVINNKIAGSLIEYQK